ncbi:MAG TPA: hypothetical protein VK527_03140, partial [Candidatus Limnocylindrales bacterium]|nr:hypothetical protein [Candidatus Limnocylindrales bacterium]
MPMRSRARAIACIAAFAFVVALAAFDRAVAAPMGAGSGTAFILPSDSVQVDAAGTWTITYVAEEDFALVSGGFIEVVIPSGWSPPQIADSTAAGYVAWTDSSKVDSVTVTDQTIRVYLGGEPHFSTATQFLAGDSLGIVYGAGGGSASARAQ